MAEKTAIVTGASRGIGRAIALELAEKGYKVITAALRFVQSRRQKKSAQQADRQKPYSVMYQIT